MSYSAPALDAPSGFAPVSPAEVTLGFIPLVDSAPLIVAAEKGFAAAENLTLSLVREASWANIRDRVMLGHFHGAHMLGPLPIASTLGAGGHLQVPMIAPFSLGLGGSVITVSTELFAAMEEEGARIGAGPAALGRTLAQVVARRATKGKAALTFAAVHPFSAHNYELRYWVAAAGIDPDNDLRLVVLPPSYMVDALKAGHVDGFTVGDPWNSFAVDQGVGVILTTKSELWRQGPDKVLGLRADFAERYPGRLAPLLRALYRAGIWAADSRNHPELAELLARPEYVGAPARVIIRALSGRLVLRPGGAPVDVPDFIIFHDRAANFPWESHALWFYSQMVRWGQAPYSPVQARTVRAVYRPDLYRAALAPLGADLPSSNAKVEGALTEPTPVASSQGRLVLGPDGFFDGLLFDPDRLEDYLDLLGVAR
jgi:NitT/TauT family transport system ATP-binding protein